MHRDIQPSNASQGCLSKKRCIVLGSGPSAKDFKAPDGIDVIGVNDTAEWTDRLTWWFSLDHSDANYARVYKRRSDCRYAVAWPSIHKTPNGVVRFRRVERRGQEPWPSHTADWYLWRWRCVLGLSEYQGSIHSGNSAYGAVGLAYHLGYTDVALVGVDGTRDTRVGGGIPNNLSHLPLLFASALEQINIVSCGALKGIPHMSLSEWLECTS